METILNTAAENIMNQRAEAIDASLMELLREQKIWDGDSSFFSRDRESIDRTLKVLGYELHMKVHQLKSGGERIVLELQKVVSHKEIIIQYPEIKIT